MPTKKLSSVKGRVIRLTRLDECGAPMTGACAYIVSAGFVSVEIESEEEAGEEYTLKNAWGDFCVNDKDGDRVKWVNVTIQLCEIDPEILEMVGGAHPVEDAQQNMIGATFGPEPNPTSFAVEVWTKKAGTGQCDPAGSGQPDWGYFVVPNIRNGKLTDSVNIENGPLTISLAGEGVQANAAWGIGPHGDNPLKNAAGFPEGDLWGAVITDVQPPQPTDGCQTLGTGQPATGATAGSPGAMTPAGASPPADLASMTGLAASPTTAWGSDEYVTLGDGSNATWNGTAWVAWTDPNDVTATYPDAAALADLATLKADGTYGDAGTAPPYNGGTSSDAAFSAGQYIVLSDASRAHWDGSAWQTGAAT